jgi:hypothetical protein
MRVPRELIVEDKTQNRSMGAGAMNKCELIKGSGGHILLFLGEVNKDIFVRGKRSTMHVSPCQTATVNLLQNRPGLLSALSKHHNICIINRANISSREVRGVANINHISIVK